MKVLPHTSLPKANGNVLHDWHAEVVAIRAFNRFLLDECKLLSTPPYHQSHYIRQRGEHERTKAEYQPFTVKEDVDIHMYCSEAPCGDASMELTMAAQEDATPWASAPPTISQASNSESSDTALELLALRGRSNFSYLGAVRLKPSRPDAPPTLSKSCSDKLAMKQCTSLLSSTTSLLISPRNAYFSSLVLPKSQHVETACTRAFSRQGRMSGITPEVERRWRESGSGYRFRPFDVRTTEREYEWSRRRVAEGVKAVPSNLSAVYTPHLQETLIGGTLQGRKQFDPRGASAVCRRSMWKHAAEVAGIVGLPVLIEALGKARYIEVKEDRMMAERRSIKDVVYSEALKGWVRNTGGVDFGLDEIT
ncbi:adenosine deaminase/editase [Lophiotrema nucula]|uniref:Adenosine deaminase/editase n=1 Tax=Lophiotrema nucula TaxID=690887 RepID=A0A6A5Z4T8_9PLEO|nr:adenosine deaminase/editase [Lophiotrema nucula]